MKKKLNPKLQAWIDARARYRLSHAQVQMARALGFLPKTLGKLATGGRQSWKLPLPQHIERLYLERFGRERPEVVRSIEEQARFQRQKRAARRERRRHRGDDTAAADGGAEVETGEGGASG